MRWEEETRERPLILDCFAASDIIYSAYMEGFINWNIYNLAQERIRRTMNGTWMFEKQTKDII
jgi:hypothetical protein